MKTISKVTGMMTLALMLTFSTYAANSSHAVKKAREAVEEAKPYDWETYAESAKVCFSRKENIEQALDWINKSIEINENTVNLEIKGDYYAAIGEKKEAMMLYTKAVSIGKAHNYNFDISSLQAKIWNLR